MTPYIAIIKDSFRAAIQSRTLWTLFVVVTLLLLVIMPFGYTEMLTGSVTFREVRNWPGFLERLHDHRDADTPGPERHIWSQLSGPLQQEVEKLYDQLDELEERLEEGESVGVEEARMRGRALATQINTYCQALHSELDGVLLSSPDFYDKQAFRDIDPNEELSDLLSQDAGDLPELKLRRRNRLLLEASFPGLIPRSPALAIRPTYGGKSIGRAEGNTKDAVIEWYEGWIGFMINWPVSMVMVFVAIIATCGIMPRMFEPGSISLLLSKPITRSRLFLSQFAGGCAFMVIAAVYFTVGVWLIAGMRLGIWNPNVFLCIPLFTLMFVVYFAVSAYVGVVYRSAIMSVLAVILFFFLCFFVGWAKVEYEDHFVDAARFVHVIDTGDMVIGGDDFLGTTNHYTFDEGSSEWKDIYVERDFSVSSGSRPIYDPGGNQLLSVASVGFSHAQMLSVGQAVDGWERKRGVLAPPNTVRLLVEPDGGILAVSREGFYRLNGEAWVDPESFRDANSSPRDTQPDEPELDPTDDPQPLPEDDAPADCQEEEPVTEDEISADNESAEDDATETSDEPEDGADANEAAEESEDASENEKSPDESSTEEDAPDENQDEPAEDVTTLPSNEFGIDDQTLAALFPFDLVGPDEQPLPTEPPMAVAIDPSNSRIAVYANGEVATYDRDEDKNYIQTARKDLADSMEKAATLAAAGPVVVVGRDDGTILVLSADTLDTEQTFTPEREVSVRFVKSSDNGEWVAILFHNRKLWLYNTREKKLTKPNIWTQGDISAVGFSGNGLLVVDRVARVREMELPSLEVKRTLSPSELPYLSEAAEVYGFKVNVYTFHRWILTPLYTILPKPGELGWAINYLATGEQTHMGFLSQWTQRGESTSDERHKVRNPWRGVRSCAIFIVFMLCLSCWQISRTEF